MKPIFTFGAVLVLFISSLATAQMIVEEEFIVSGQPTTTSVVPQTPVVVTPYTTVVTTTPASIVVVPAEQEVYVGMSKYHVVEALGQPTYVEKFRGYTRRHHGIYDEVWTYTTPTGGIVLYLKERRVQKVEYQ